MSAMLRRVGFERPTVSRGNRQGGECDARLPTGWRRMNDPWMAALAEEARAFESMKADLRKRRVRGYAVVYQRELRGTFAARDAAYSDALQRFGTKAPFLIRSVDRDEWIEAPALVLGLLDAELSDSATRKR